LTFACLNGEYFIETRQCICNQCYSGTNCTIVNPNCVIQLNHQQCTLCREWWRRVEEKSVMSLDFQLKYQEYPSQSGLGPLLTETIRKVHQQANNAETEGYHMVFGTGGTQLLHAFLYAFNQMMKRPLNIYSRTPYYQYYKTYSDMNPCISTFNQSRDMNPRDVLEFVAIPNNPDGAIHQRSFYNTPLVVYDLVYYWPHNTEGVTKASFPIMLFSLSKMTGHSSSRFGWALIKDKTLADHMVNYIWLLSHGVAIESQYRAYKVLSNILETKDNFYIYMKQLMMRRWDRLLDIFQRFGRGRFTILSPKGFVVAWIRCNQLERNQTCHQLFLENNIFVNPGETYGSDPNHARFNMQGEESTFDILLNYLVKMMSK